MMEGYARHQSLELRLAVVIGAVSTGSLLLGVLIQDATIARAPLGVVAAGLAPGFGLMLALFPRRGSGLVERLALSVPVSLVIDVVLGVLLDVVPGGLTPVSTSVAAWAVTMALLALGGYRARQPPTLKVRPVPSRGLSAETAIRVLMVGGVACVAVLSFASAVPTTAKPFTALSVAGASGNVDADTSLRVTIDNQEGQVRLYDVEIRAGPRILKRLDAVPVASGEVYSFDIPPLLPSGPATDVVVYLSGARQPYRQLRLPAQGF